MYFINKTIGLRCSSIYFYVKRKKSLAALRTYYEIGMNSLAVSSTSIEFTTTHLIRFHFSLHGVREIYL